MKNEEMVIKHNPLKKYPYEVWFGRDLVETFVSEETAKEMLEINEKTHELYIRNQYEKYVLHSKNPNLGCIHDNK